MAYFIGEQNFSTTDRYLAHFFVGARRNLATLGVWPIKTCSTNFVNFVRGSCDTMRRHDALAKWYFDNFRMFADSFRLVSVHSVARGLD